MRQVVHLIPKFSSSHWGGAESSIAAITPHLVREGYQSEVWAGSTFGVEGSSREKDLPVRRFPGFYLSRSEASAAGVGKASISPAMLKAIRRTPRDTIFHLHTHNRMASAVAAICRLSLRPTVLTIHSEVAIIRPRLRYWFPNEAAIRWSDAVICVAPYLRERVLDLGRTDSVEVIPNGVDVERFAVGDGERFREGLGVGKDPLVLVMGRICDVKNQMAMIRIFPSVLSVVPEAHLALVGFPSDVGYFETLKREFVELGLMDRVHIVPGVSPASDDLVNAYAASDVVAMPSKMEALPLVAMEAWAAGIPLVAFEVGGLQTLVQEGKTGLLVTPGDERAFSDAIASVLSKDSLRARLTAGGRLAAQEVSWPRIARQIAGVYSTVRN